MSRVVVDCHMVGQPQAGDAGNARYAAALVTALAATARPGDDVAALVAHPHNGELGGAPTAGVPAANVRRILRSGPRALAALAADAAVFTYVAPPRPPCPVLVAVHDTSFITNPEWLSPRARAMLRALVPRAARRARLVLALSQTAKADVSAALGVAPERVRVVSPPPGRAFTPGDRAAAAARVAARFGLDRYLLAVGDVSPRKNLEALGEAVRRVNAPGVDLVFVGRVGQGGGAILRSAGARWLGRVEDEDLADLYRAAAATVQPSLYEGFGLTVLEALACGSPVVASRRGATPEVAGDAAILVEPDVDAIAEGLRAALEPETAARLAAAGPERAARYRPETMGSAAWSAVREATG
jgi:glycosyltransferase involved in cell wall biosynthesis